MSDNAPEQPWLLNKDWQTPEVKSDALMTVYVIWGFCLVWNLLSIPLLLALPDEILESENYPAAIGLLFPLMGIFILIKAVMVTLEYRRFGKTLMVLDPFPGAIGGHVGGTIDLAQSFDMGQAFEITLANYYSYISGSGKNRSRRERVLWNRTQIAHAEPYLSGTRLYFRFDVPEAGEVKPSDLMDKKRDYNLWRVNLTSKMPGVDLDRNFVIPVYATAERARHIDDRVATEIKNHTLAYDKAGLGHTLPLKLGVSGYELYYPAFRHIKAGLSWMVFAFIFLGSAVFATEVAGFPPILFGFIFGGIGVLMFLTSVYAMTNSLRVFSDGANLNSQRRILGLFSVNKSMPLDDILRLDYNQTSSSGTGNRAISWYRIRAVDRHEKSMTIAEGLEGKGQVDLAMEEIKKTFHLK